MGELPQKILQLKYGSHILGYLFPHNENGKREWSQQYPILVRAKESYAYETDPSMPDGFVSLPNYMPLFDHPLQAKRAV